MLYLSLKMNPSEENPAQQNIHSLRADVAATSDVLKVTVDKLVRRGENLDALNHRAEDLNATSYHFRGTARRVHRNMAWRNYKLTIFIGMFNFNHCAFRYDCLFLLVLLIICIIALIILFAVRPWKK